jgi:hypothetical protein
LDQENKGKFFLEKKQEEEKEAQKLEREPNLFFFNLENKYKIASSPIRSVSRSPLPPRQSSKPSQTLLLLS